MRKFAAVLFAFTLLTACANQNRGVHEAQTESQIPQQTDDEERHQSLNIVPIEWKKLKMATTDLNPVKEDDIHTVIKRVKFEDVTVSLYTKTNTDSNIFASIKTTDENLEIPTSIGYNVDPTGFTIDKIDFNGMPLYKITGYLGASVPLTEYIQIIDDSPMSFWETESYVDEYDADMDGVKELIAAAGGTIPDTTIIKMDNGEYITANLNELTKGSASFDSQSNLFNVYYGPGGKKPEQYKLTSNGLELVGYID
ncbi:hypothetical protein [Paenibacillus kobensis]|uniref:hypothetical protein n=1 Tax=Paenibacillus kobensis TaxID=59841 RepID=UPI000FD9DE15|nr:hypothetical protein [Paenibacillus kobensis]